MQQNAQDNGRKEFNTATSELVDTGDPDEMVHYEPSRLDLQCLLAEW